MIVDTHCHLIDDAFEKDREVVVQDAIERGVKMMIVPSTSLGESKEVVGWAEKTNGVLGLVGVHPETVMKNEKIDIEGLRELPINENVVGIG